MVGTTFVDSLITGHTLAQRTRERNFLHKRLHGAITLCKHMGTSALELEARVAQLAEAQKQDRVRTLEKRKVMAEIKGRPTAKYLGEL